MSSQPEEESQPAEVITEQTFQEPAKELVISETPALTTFRASADILKFPRHILAKTSRGQRQTDIRIGDKGKGQYWHVTSNPKIGVPGKMSFDFDYQVLHQKFYEAILKARQNGHQTAPRYIVVGSLREIAKQLGLKSPDTVKVRKAIESNQAAVIQTDQAIRFINENGKAEHLSGQFNAYNVYIRGDHLPDGDEAKKVVLELSIPFWQALNAQEFSKPLDGHYFKQLAKPGAQRWYTLVSTDIFVALSKNLPYAKVRYSEYCKFHPQKRHKTFAHMQRQMNNLHQKHVELEYINPPQYEKIKTEQGINDWWILYKPGQKAHQEYRQNRKRTITRPAVKELPAESDTSQDSYNLVTYFQKQKNNQDMYSPTTKELNQAAGLINKHGTDRAKRIVGLAIQEMAKTNFNPQFFGGVLQYETPALETIELKEKQDQQTREKQKADHEALVKQYQDWLKLAPEERVNQRLESFKTLYQGLHKRQPNEQEIEERRKELTESLPTPEEYQVQLFGRIIFQ